MEQIEIEVPNLTLSYLIAELRPLLEGSYVNKVQEISGGILKLKLRTKEGSRDLIITPQALYFSSFRSEASTSGFAAFLKKRIGSRKIISIEQHEADRIVVIEIGDCFLVLEFFAEGNAVLCGKDWKILQPYHRGEWKDRSLRKGADYRFPSSRGKNPSQASAQEIIELRNAKGTIASALIANYNIAPVLAEHALLESGISKSEAASKLNEEKSEALAKSIRGLYSMAAKAEPVLAKQKSGFVLLPFPLQLAAHEALQAEKSFSSLSEALDETISPHILSPETEKETGLRSRSERLGHSINSQETALERLEAEALECQKKAELILSMQPKVQELLFAFNSGFEKKLSEAELRKKIVLAEKQGFLPKGMVLSVDRHSRKVVLELPEC